jgi:hypothetical protein
VIAALAPARSPTEFLCVAGLRVGSQPAIVAIFDVTARVLFHCYVVVVGEGIVMGSLCTVVVPPCATDYSGFYLGLPPCDAILLDPGFKYFAAASVPFILFAALFSSVVLPSVMSTLPFSLCSGCPFFPSWCAFRANCVSNRVSAFQRMSAGFEFWRAGAALCRIVAKRTRRTMHAIIPYCTGGSYGGMCRGREGRQLSSAAEIAVVLGTQLPHLCL